MNSSLEKLSGSGRNSRHYNTKRPLTLRDLVLPQGTASSCCIWSPSQSPSLISQVFEAYGQTECTAGCTFTLPGDWTAGRVSVYWAVGAVVGRRALTELGLRSLANLSALDECGQGQTRVLIPTSLSWHIIFQSYLFIYLFLESIHTHL